MQLRTLVSAWDNSTRIQFSFNRAVFRGKAQPVLVQWLSSFQESALETEQQLADGPLFWHLSLHWAGWQLQSTASESLRLLHNRLQCTTAPCRHSCPFHQLRYKLFSECRARSAGSPAWIMQSAHGSLFRTSPSCFHHSVQEDIQKMNTLMPCQYIQQHHCLQMKWYCIRATFYIFFISFNKSHKRRESTTYKGKYSLFFFCCCRKP